MQVWVSKLSSRSQTSYWADYQDRNSYQYREISLKKDFVSKFVHRHRPGTLVDLGGNTGEFTSLVVKAGVAHALVVDADPQALNTCYRQARSQQLPVSTLLSSLTDPSPARGWNHVERQSFNQRVCADAMLALALIHHLVISGNIPLTPVLNWLMDRAPRGIIEYVPKTDPMVERMLALRPDNFSDYTLSNVRKVISERARIEHESVLSDSGKVLIEYFRK